MQLAVLACSRLKDSNKLTLKVILGISHESLVVCAIVYPSYTNNSILSSESVNFLVKLQECRRDSVTW